MSREDFFWALGIGGFCALFLGLIGFAIYDENRMAREWEAFRVARQCRVTQTMPGETFNTISIGANGQPSIGIGSTSAKQAWLCNDGVTYWRNS